MEWNFNSYVDLRIVVLKVSILAPEFLSDLADLSLVGSVVRRGSRSHPSDHPSGAERGELVAGDGAGSAVRSRTRESIAVIIDPFDSSFLNYNLAVIAPSGSGKSYFTKLLALRHLVAGTEFLVKFVRPGGEIFYRPLEAVQNFEHLSDSRQLTHNLS